MRQLAEDTNIPYRSLAKPFETDFSTIFSFKPRKSKKQFPSPQNARDAALTEAYTRRLSLGTLMTRSLTAQSSESSRQIRSRPRALSTESILACNLRRYHSQDANNNIRRENQPLLNLLSFESEDRRKQLEDEDEKATSMHPPTEDYEAHQIHQATQNNTIANTLTEFRRPLLRTSSSFTSLTDQLLPVEAIIVSPPSPPPSEFKSSTLEDHARPTRLKFELPSSPARSRSPSAPALSTFNATQSVNYLSPQQTTTKQRKRRGSKGRKSKWSIGTNSDISDDDEVVSVLPVLGDKVELLRRPLPTMGIIKFIGPVQFADCPYIGVELESRLGKNDGSVDGIRYFRTDPQRGIFVKADDFIILSSNHCR